MSSRHPSIFGLISDILFIKQNEQSKLEDYLLYLPDGIIVHNCLVFFMEKCIPSNEKVR